MKTTCLLLLIVAIAAFLTWWAWLPLLLNRTVYGHDNVALGNQVESLKDEEVVFAECSNTDTAGMGLLFRDAMISGRGKYKWVEARGKKGAPGTLEIVAHTCEKISK